MTIPAEVKTARTPTPAHDEEVLMEIISETMAGGAFDGATASPVDISGCCINADDL